MAPNTRNFLVGSAVVVAAGLCTGLVAYYAGPLASSEVVRTELSYMPADATAVAFADVRGIMDSEFRQKLTEVMPTGAEKDRLLEQTGIDVERDIDSVMAGLTGAGTAGAVVVVRGRFDQGRIEALAIEHGARQEQYGGRALLVGLGTTDDIPGDHVPSIAFLDAGLLAIGDVSAVRRAIDVEASGLDVGSNPDMMRFISSVQESGNAWLVGRASPITGQVGLPDQVRQQVDGIDWLSISASVDRDVQGLIRAEARDDESAQELRTMLAGAVAAARMFGEQDGRIANALNSVQTTGSGRNVEISFVVPSSLLDVVGPRTAAIDPISAP